MEKSCQVERAFAKQEISVKLGHEEAQSDSPQQLGNILLFRVTAHCLVLETLDDM